MPIRFLIVDGYAKASRDEFDRVGMKQASRLYAAMLKRWLPEAEYVFWFPGDAPTPPQAQGTGQYSGILWTGSDLNVYHRDNPSVARQIEFASAECYEAGTPAFGSCWALQIAAAAAGGEVSANPRGREMGIARKIHLTPEGQKHPMLEGRRPVFSNFISHLDEVTELPPGAVVLAGNDFTQVQAIEVRHGSGIFWAVQYHPEYDLRDMACLITARAQKLVSEGFFECPEDLAGYVAKLEALHRDPNRKDLRWQLDIDDDVLSGEVRQIEFRNWLNKVVLPRAAGA
jgi:GMP synthase (glutamine-hydrolysing)